MGLKNSFTTDTACFKYSIVIWYWESLKSPKMPALLVQEVPDLSLSAVSTRDTPVTPIGRKRDTPAT